MNRILTIVCGVSLILCCGTGPATTQAVDDQKQFESWWDDLKKQEPWPAAALLNMSTQPKQTIAFFKTHLLPLKIEQKDLDVTLSALGSEDEKIWKPAMEKLTYLDPRLNQSVDTLMDNANDPLQRQRLAALLGDNSVDQWKGWDVAVEKNGGQTYFTYSQNGSRSMTYVATKVSQINKTIWVRSTRAVVLLQHFGTPDAIELLKEMASGNPSAQPTAVAKAALESLGK